MTPFVVEQGINIQKARGMTIYNTSLKYNRLTDNDNHYMNAHMHYTLLSLFVTASFSKYHTCLSCFLALPSLLVLFVLITIIVMHTHVL